MRARQLRASSTPYDRKGLVKQGEPCRAVFPIPNQAAAEQIGEEVASAREDGQTRIEASRRLLDAATRGANGTSSEAAGAIKDWER